MVNINVPAGVGAPRPDTQHHEALNKTDEVLISEVV